MARGRALFAPFRATQVVPPALGIAHDTGIVRYRSFLTEVLEYAIAEEVPLRQRLRLNSDVLPTSRSNVHQAPRDPVSYKETVFELVALDVKGDAVKDLVYRMIYYVPEAKNGTYCSRVMATMKFEEVWYWIMVYDGFAAAQIHPSLEHMQYDATAMMYADACWRLHQDLDTLCREALLAQLLSR